MVIFLSCLIAVFVSVVLGLIMPYLIERGKYGGEEKMFKKKKKGPQIIPINDWEKDFGFLFLIMERRKQMLNRYVIDVFESILSDTQPFKDNELTEPAEEAISDIIEMLSDNYKNILILKYFKDEESLIRFVAEDIYNFVINEATLRNKNKAIRKLSDNILRKLEGTK